MNTDEYDFALPTSLIAQTPLTERSAARMLVLDRKTGEVSHRQFHELPHFLEGGDLLIANDSRVIPARLLGVKEGTGAVVELLLLRPLADAGCWEVLAKPGRRLKRGHVVVFGHGQLNAEVLDADAGANGTRTVRFSASGELFDALLETLGDMPLPPYIRTKLTDPERYQTVYAQQRGSVAAPTAGLHFTPAILAELAAKGVAVEFVTLHVGLGTFRPVQSERIEDHHMHEEWYQVERSLLAAIRRVREQGKRVLAIGTTTVRALESAARMEQMRTTDAEEALCGFTDIFIYPGVPLLATDSLLTNFHLPKSTLLMLVATLVGRERLLHAYREAVEQQYRFFSFGDAMLIV